MPSGKRRRKTTYLDSLEKTANSSMLTKGTVLLSMLLALIISFAIAKFTTCKIHENHLLNAEQVFTFLFSAALFLYNESLLEHRDLKDNKNFLSSVLASKDDIIEQVKGESRFHKIPREEIESSLTVFVERVEKNLNKLETLYSNKVGKFRILSFFLYTLAILITVTLVTYQVIGSTLWEAISSHSGYLSKFLSYFQFQIFSSAKFLFFFQLSIVIVWTVFAILMKYIRIKSESLLSKEKFVEGFLEYLETNFDIPKENLAKSIIDKLNSKKQDGQQT